MASGCKFRHLVCWHDELSISNNEEKDFFHLSANENVKSDPKYK